MYLNSMNYYSGGGSTEVVPFVRIPLAVGIY